MFIPLLKELTQEKIVILKPSLSSKLPFRPRGITRLIDVRGDTIGLFLSKSTLKEFEEEIESENPGFLASLEESRKSGRVSGINVKKKARL